MVPRLDSAITASALGMPWAASVVPSSGIDRDVDLRRRAVADLLAVVEHRRLVLLALPDHHHAVHLDRLEHEAHAVDGGLVGRLLVSHAHQRRGRQRGGLGHPHELQGQVAVGPLAISLCRQDRKRITAALRLRSCPHLRALTTRIKEML